MNRFGKSLMTLLAVGLFAAAFGANTQHGQGTGGGPEKITQSSGNGGVVANTNSGKSSVGNKNTVQSEIPGEVQVPDNGGGTGNGFDWVTWGLVIAFAVLFIVVLIVIAVVAVSLGQCGKSSKHNVGGKTNGGDTQKSDIGMRHLAGDATPAPPAVPASAETFLEDVRKSVAESENRIVDYLEKGLNALFGEIVRTPAAEQMIDGLTKNLQDAQWELDCAKSELAAANEKLKELECAQSELAAACAELTKLKNDLAAACAELEELESAKSEFETKLTAANVAANEKLKELDCAKSELAAANEKLKHLECVRCDLEMHLAELDHEFRVKYCFFYGEETEEFRGFLLETQNVDVERGRMLIAAWLRLVITKQVSPNDLKEELESFDSTVWRLFGAEDLERLHAVRGYIAPRIRELLDGSGLEFMWPAPDTELGVYGDRICVEGGEGAVLFGLLKKHGIHAAMDWKRTVRLRYAICGCIESNGVVVTKSRVVCYDE